MDLREWTILYVKHNDVHTKKLQDYKNEGDKVVFRFKDHHMHAYAMEKLDIIPVEGKTLLVTLQKKENIQFLLKHWDDFVQPGLTLVFVNPEKNEKWFIVPHTHSQIADPNIELGIRSLAENVSYV
jgi:hypothetical protein